MPGFRGDFGRLGPRLSERAFCQLFWLAARRSALVNFAGGTLRVVPDGDQAIPTSSFTIPGGLAATSVLDNRELDVARHD